jgi:hypothetical protein
MDYFCKDSHDGVEFYGKWNKPQDKNGYFNFIGATKEEVDAAIANNTGILFESREALKEAAMYWFERMAAYPSVEEQFDLLYHSGYDAWKTSIDAVKQQFPKP